MQPSRFALFATLVALPVLSAGAPRAQMLVGTADDGAHAWLFPMPIGDLPAPPASDLTVLPAEAWPHGVAYVRPHRALVADFGRSRVFALNPLQNELLDTIPTAPWDATGSIALSPDGAFALASGGDGGVATGLLVIEEPFSGAPVVRTLALPSDQHVHSWQTAAIRFAPDGRAFVATHHRNFVFGQASPNASFVHVLEPPFTAIAESIALPVGAASTTNFDHAEGVAVTPDGATVLVTNGDAELYVLRAPFAEGMAVETVGLGGVIRNGSSVAVSPDGAAALLTDYNGSQFDRVMKLAAPFASLAGSSFFIGPGGAGSGRGFEHVAVAPDGRYAYVTGNVLAGQTGDLWLIKDPFSFAPSNWPIALPANERGAGAVEIASSLIFSDPFETGNFARWSAHQP